VPDPGDSSALTYDRIAPEFHAPRLDLRRRLGAALIIAAAAALLELVGSRISGSLALLSDAGHVGTDAAALGLSLWAVRASERPHTPRMSFGYHRTEVLAAMANGLLLVAIAVYLLAEAYGRSSAPPVVEGGIMFAVGLAGLAANVTMLFLLRIPARRNLNVRGAFLHAYGDALGSAGVVTAAVLIQTTGLFVFDLVVAGFIVVLILVSAGRLLREGVGIVLEASPVGLRPEDVARMIVSVPGVRAVHDLHIWTVTSGLYWLTGHILVSGDMTVKEAGSLVDRIQVRLREEFSIAHATLQVDSVQEEMISPGDVAKGPD
jgi:cobalt-zinc-cadmium efflux system protein